MADAHRHHATARGRRRGLRGACAAALCVAGIAVSPAAAQTVTFTFYGRGNGHGIGMSQYGAQGAARAGWSAARILAWFYRGTTIAHVTAGNIRVDLADYAAQFGVGVQGGGQLLDVASGARTTLAPGVGYVVRPSGADVVVTGSGGAVIDRGAKGVQILPTGSGLVTFNGRPYRGTLVVSASGGAIRAVNVVAMEQYLRGVVPSEMPSSWASAALEAQAIAARSYALRSRNPSAPYDVYADTRSQAYGGVRAEAPASTAAVTATTGEALTYGGSVVQAYFAASDGGYTESVQNVWGGSPTPYLTGVPDPFDTISPTHLWANPPRFTGARLGSLLGTGGTVTKITVLKRGVSPRVVSARVSLASGASAALTGSDIEAALGLPSTWFWVGQSNLPMPHEPAISGSPATPSGRPPTVAHVARGSYLVVASSTSNLAAARQLAVRVRQVAPGEQIMARGSARHRHYLVVAIRLDTHAQATAAHLALKQLGYGSVIMRAVAYDPAPRPAALERLVAPPRPPAAPDASTLPASDLVPQGSTATSAGAPPAP